MLVSSCIVAGSRHKHTPTTLSFHLVQSAMVCPKLVETGICPDGDSCRYTHFLKFCELCNTTLVTEQSFHAHLSGKWHAKRVYHVTGASNGTCTACNTPYGPPNTVGSFVAHCRTVAHQQNAEQARAHFDSERHDVEVIPENSSLCTTCNRVIADYQWQAHLRTTKHRAATKYHTTKAVFDNLTQNRHAVEISGDEERGFDFGVVAPSAPTATISFDITATSPGQIRLVDVKLSSLNMSRRFSVPSQ